MPLWSCDVQDSAAFWWPELKFRNLGVAGPTLGPDTELVPKKCLLAAGRGGPPMGLWRKVGRANAVEFWKA